MAVSNDHESRAWGGKCTSAAQKGFTLIEVMIVGTIIAILVGLSVLVYQDYAVRARVSEALSASAVARTAVIDNATSNTGDFAYGYPPPNTSVNLDGIAIDSATGVITVDLGSAAGGGTLTIIPYTGPGSAPVALVAGIVPNGVIQWRCRAAGSSFALGMPGTTPAKFAPADCR